MYNKTITILLLIFITFSCKKEEYSLTKIEATQIKTDSLIVENDSIAQFIEPFKLHLNNQLDSILTTTTSDLTKNDGVLESSLGNLMADICLSQANPVFNKRTSKNIDFVLLNHGGIRAPIPKGTISARNAFEVMPFENELVVVELSGNKTKELLLYLASEQKAHPIGNMILEIKKKSPTDFDAVINGKHFDYSKSYFVLTSDYLQQGGDRMNFFAEPLTLHKLDYKLRNALVDSFKKTDSIIPTLDNRFAYDD